MCIRDRWWTLPDSIVQRYGNDALQGALVGIANLLAIVAPLYLMCAPRDISVVYQVKAPITCLLYTSRCV